MGGAENSPRTAANTSPPDMIDALTFTSPTPFSPFGVIARWAIFAVALLAALRRRLRLRPQTWRIAHMSFAVVIIIGCGDSGRRRAERALRDSKFGGLQHWREVDMPRTPFAHADDALASYSRACHQGCADRNTLATLFHILFLNCTRFGLGRMVGGSARFLHSSTRRKIQTSPSVK